MNHGWTGRAMVQVLVVAFALLAEPTKAFYSPVQGRWLSRDPLGEKGAANLHSFVENRVLNAHDRLGLHSCGECSKWTSWGNLEWDAREGRFTGSDVTVTVEELHMLTLLWTRGCGFPSIMCECKDDKAKQKGRFSPRQDGEHPARGDGTIFLNCTGDKTAGDYLLTRRHELVHALDSCSGSKPSCYEPGASDFICSEIRAYAKGSVIVGRNEIIRAALGSFCEVCADTENQLIVQACIRSNWQKAEALYDRCSQSIDVWPLRSLR